MLHYMSNHTYVPSFFPFFWAFSLSIHSIPLSLQSISWIYFPFPSIITQDYSNYIFEHESRMCISLPSPNSVHSPIGCRLHCCLMCSLCTSPIVEMIVIVYNNCISVFSSPVLLSVFQVKSLQRNREAIHI